MNILRRLPLNRLLLACALAVALAVSGAALASAVSSAPKPAAKPLAQAVHDALTAQPVEGVSAQVTLTNHLLEGASIASGSGGAAGQLAGNPLISGASGRLWIAKDGRVRLELQSEKGDSQLIYDGHTITFYDASNNTVYHYTPTSTATSGSDPSSGVAEPKHEAPTVAKIEEAIAHARTHANVSEATPTDVAGQPAYTVRVSPNEKGSLIGGVELSFDANTGVPLRAAVYSTTTSAPVIELAASEVSYGPVAGSVFSFTPPPGAKVEEIKTESGTGGAAKPPAAGDTSGNHGVTVHGSGITSIVEAQHTTSGKSSSTALEGLPKVNINGASASELKTALGTVLSFERSGVRYIVAGALPAGTVEAFARGL
jgi:outer membrane lipoprotein-sorting protein